MCQKHSPDAPGGTSQEKSLHIQAPTLEAEQEPEIAPMSFSRTVPAGYDGMPDLVPLQHGRPPPAIKK